MRGGGQSLVDYGTISWRIINTSYIHNRLKNTFRWPPIPHSSFHSCKLFLYFQKHLLFGIFFCWNMDKRICKIFVFKVTRPVHCFNNPKNNYCKYIAQIVVCTLHKLLYAHCTLHKLLYAHCTNYCMHIAQSILCTLHKLL